MAYYQTKQGGDIANAIPLGTTGGAVSGMPNYGISVITATSAEVYVLQPPIAGVEKTLVFHGYSTSALPVVKLCTNTAQTVSLLGKSTNLTVIKAAAGLSTVAPTIVQLKGYNTTSWIITNVFPANVTTGTTVIGIGISVSST